MVKWCAMYLPGEAMAFGQQAVSSALAAALGGGGGVLTSARPDARYEGMWASYIFMMCIMYILGLIRLERIICLYTNELDCMPPPIPPSIDTPPSRPRPPLWAASWPPSQ